MTDLFSKTTGIGGHHSARSTTDTWLTPPGLIGELGGASSFDLDPCTPENRPWDTAKNHFTKHDNGLMKPWFGRVWLNPPYQRGWIEKWLARMAHHGNGTALVFARTETRHFARYIWETCDALFFFEGRLTFHMHDGRQATKNSGAPSVLCAYGEEDADCLAGLERPGAFIPLRLRGYKTGLEKSGTWMEEVIAWMTGEDGGIHLSDMYRAFASSPKAKHNRNYQAKIRQTLQKGPFTRVGPGVWELEV